MTGSSSPIIAEVHVCVVGAGSAGSSAAIAAGRSGASVLLVDRLPFLGGTSTSVLDTLADDAILELPDPPRTAA